MREEGENRRLGVLQVQAMRTTINDLISSKTPSRAIGKLISRMRSPDASAFERYAGIVLNDAGGSLIANTSPTRALRLSPPSEGRLARLSWANAETSTAERTTLLDVESALNRLICIADTIEDSARSFTRHDKRAISISIMGVSYLSKQPGYRSARVTLPPIGLAEQATPAYFNEVDWRVLDHIASNAHTIFQNSILPNMNQTLMGASAPDGSDWDIRTRMAWILEQLELPLHFECRFDCDASERNASVRFTIPSARSLPQRLHIARESGLAPIAEHVEDARMAYTLRLACLLGAACFGSGKRLENAFVTAERESWKAPIFSCKFNRSHYVHATLTNIDSGALESADYRFSPSDLAKLIAPDEMRFANFADEGSSVDVIDDGMKKQRIEPWDDNRPLPESMSQLFHAKRICDIDTRHYHGSCGPLIDEARNDAEESVITGIANLERIVDELEWDMRPPDDNANARPLFCDNPLSRVSVSLIDDQISVGDEAEAFLEGDANHAKLKAKPWYFRAPNALFHAHMGLSDLYERLGDYKGAESQADRCIALAPTTAQAHFRKADILAQQGRYAEAANIITDALNYTVLESDCSLLYYHLALILWRLGRQRDAIAIYVYTASLRGDFAEKAAKTVEGLRKRNDSPVIVYASPLAAAREMTRSRIPLAPSDSARALVARAAIGLANAGAPEAAAPYAAAIAHYCRDNRIIVSACRSLQFGTKGRKTGTQTSPSSRF